MKQFITEKSLYVHLNDGFLVNTFVLRGHKLERLGTSGWVIFKSMNICLSSLFPMIVKWLSFVTKQANWRCHLHLGDCNTHFAPLFIDAINQENMNIIISFSPDLTLAKSPVSDNVTGRRNGVFLISAKSGRDLFLQGDKGSFEKKKLQEYSPAEPRLWPWI